MKRAASVLALSWLGTDRRHESRSVFFASTQTLCVRLALHQAYCQKDENAAAKPFFETIASRISLGELMAIWQNLSQNVAKCLATPC